MHFWMILQYVFDNLMINYLNDLEYIYYYIIEMQYYSKNIHAIIADQEKGINAFQFIYIKNVFHNYVNQI